MDDDTPSAPGLTISEAARLWGVHRDSVRRWVRDKAVEAHRGNDGVWRIREGQKPRPSYTPRTVQGSPLEGSEKGAVGYSKDRPSADHELALVRASLAEAERELAASRREVEVLREGLADARAERDRLHELLRATVDRPSVLERLVLALRSRWVKDPGQGG